MSCIWRSIDRRAVVRSVYEEKRTGREILGRDGTMLFGGKQLFWVKQRFSPTVLSNQSKGRGPEAWWKEGSAPITQEEKSTSETGLKQCPRSVRAFQNIQYPLREVYKNFIWLELLFMKAEAKQSKLLT